MAKKPIIRDDPRPRLAEAIASKEVLTIIYDCGKQRGLKRPALPIRLFPDYLFAIHPKYGWEHKFTVDKVRIVDVDYPAPEYQPFLEDDEDDENDSKEKEKRFVRRHLNPSARFVDGYAEGWAFRVHQAFRPALDIVLSTLLDKARSHELRLQKLYERGYSSWDELKRQVPDPEERSQIQKEINRYKRFRQVWTESLLPDGVPLPYDFHEGDILYSADNHNAVQVNSVNSDKTLSIQVFHRDGGGQIKKDKCFFCTQAEFVAVLRNGLPPDFST